jgi:hypothetical protein
LLYVIELEEARALPVAEKEDIGRASPDTIIHSLQLRTDERVNTDE